MSLSLPPENSLGEISDRSYGYEEYIREKGSGSTFLRTERMSQPGALRIGDILANGDRVLAKPRGGYNGSVWILLSGGLEGHWIDVPGRIPIALLHKTDIVPNGLIEEVQE